MRACVLASQVGCPLVVPSMSSTSAVDIVARKASKGCVVTAEVTTASLHGEGSCYWEQCWGKAAAPVISPPLREGE